MIFHKNFIIIIKKTIQDNMFSLEKDVKSAIGFIKDPNDKKFYTEMSLIFQYLPKPQ